MAASFWATALSGRTGDEVKGEVADKALDTYKRRIRQITRRTCGRSLVRWRQHLSDYVPGWKPFVARSTVLQDERNALSVLVPYSDSEHSHVKVSFFGTIGFGRVGQPDLTADGVLQVASLDDLMATKVKVVLQRAEVKDYRDIAAMVKAGVGLPRGLAAARAIFGPNFQPSESLKALVYFGDGDLHTLSQDEKSTLVTAVSAVRDLPEVVIVSKQLASTSARKLLEP